MGSSKKGQLKGILREYMTHRPTTAELAISMRGIQAASWISLFHKKPGFEVSGTTYQKLLSRSPAIAGKNFNRID